MGRPQSYYDEDNHLIIPEDPNITTTSYLCSQGHGFEVENAKDDYESGHFVELLSGDRVWYRGKRLT